VHLFSGTANPDLARRMAAVLNTSLGEVVVRAFPDGEIFVKYIQNIRGGDVFIVQPTCAPPNDTLMELLIMLDAARRASARRVTAVIPFLGYSRQDRKDQPRVPITAKLVANLLVTAGANRILTMDLHAQQMQGFFDIPVDHLYAAPVLVRYLRQAVTAPAVVVAPDSGSVKMADYYAGLLGADLAIVAKRRVDAQQVAVLNLVGEVEGRDCVLVDDLATTAGTIVAAATRLREAGARRIFTAVTHCRLTTEGYQRLADSCIDEFVTTDTIPASPQQPGVKRITILSVAELMAEAVKRIHEERSVTTLFQLA